MTDRKAFLARLGVTGMLFAATRAANAQTASPAASLPSPEAAAPPAPAAKKAKGPSAASVAIAATMRRFDAKLTDAELATIATQIDENAGAGAVLNPKKRRLKNSDEPATTFAAGKR
jgi:hypothetical protein